jgi:hypothetical protein
MIGVLSAIDWTKVAAFLGALAWLPHLVRWFIRPRVTIIPGVSVEIGFTALGPLFNPTLAFLTERRAALITRITFDVTHEKGQRATFLAQQLVETAGSTQNSAGDYALHSRTHSVIAVAMIPGQISERKINCRESSGLTRHEVLVADYQNAVRRTRDPDMMKWAAAAATSPECHALRKFWANEAVWQTGNYTVVARARVDELGREVTTQFSLTIPDEHIRLLSANAGGLDYELKGIFADIAQEPRDPPRYAWQWIYPAIRVTAA